MVTAGSTPQSSWELLMSGIIPSIDKRLPPSPPVSWPPSTTGESYWAKPGNCHLFCSWPAQHYPTWEREGVDKHLQVCKISHDRSGGEPPLSGQVPLCHLDAPPLSTSSPLVHTSTHAHHIWWDRGSATAKGSLSSTTWTEGNLLNCIHPSLTWPLRLISIVNPFTISRWFERSSSGPPGKNQ